jgi:hypothetical protein
VIQECALLRATNSLRRGIPNKIKGVLKIRSIVIKLNVLGNNNFHRFSLFVVFFLLFVLVPFRAAAAQHSMLLVSDKNDEEIEDIDIEDDIGELSIEHTR